MHVADVFRTDPHQDDSFVALKPGGDDVDPAVDRVVIPRPALRVTVVQSAREFRIVAQMPPRDTAVVRPSDLGPNDVAETSVDDRVQVEHVAYPQQVGRDYRADAAAHPAGRDDTVRISP